jgi:hypothetical protein
VSVVMLDKQQIRYAKHDSMHKTACGEDREHAQVQ